MNAVDERMNQLLRWCASVLGACELYTDQTRDHPEERTSAYRLSTDAGACYLKTYRDRPSWEREVHGYEQWAPAFHGQAPRLLAVHDEEPLALVVSALPGTILEYVQLTPAQERAVWRSAGRALAGLHALESGACFGPCRRDGSCAGAPIADAPSYIAAELDDWVMRGLRLGCLSAQEQHLVAAARGLLAAFQGERPTACHRDYCSANWLVDDAGQWVGVIDFEFAYWDVRVADFARHPNWEWLTRDDLVAAFFEGYGRSLTASEEQQRLLALVDYALGAIVWGHENAYYGFAKEGREAFVHLAKVL
jgi:aminoglycoside phosphotransferase